MAIFLYRVDYLSFFIFFLHPWAFNYWDHHVGRRPPNTHGGFHVTRRLLILLPTNQHKRRIRIFLIIWVCRVYYLQSRDFYLGRANRKFKGLGQSVLFLLKNVWLHFVYVEIFKHIPDFNFWRKLWSKLMFQTFFFFCWKFGDLFCVVGQFVWHYIIFILLLIIQSVFYLFYIHVVLKLIFY